MLNQHTVYYNKMSRHRNVRNMNYDDEYDGYDDVYGRSVEDDHYCVSPTAAEFMYDRSSKTHSMSAFMSSQGDIAEEIEQDLNITLAQQPFLARDPVEQAKISSCLDKIREIVGNSIVDSKLVAAIVDNDFDLEKSLETVLTLHGSDRTEAVSQPGRERVEDNGITDEKFTIPISLLHRSPRNAHGRGRLKINESHLLKKPKSVGLSQPKPVASLPTSLGLSFAQLAQQHLQSSPLPDANSKIEQKPCSPPSFVASKNENLAIKDTFECNSDDEPSDNMEIDLMVALRHGEPALASVDTNLDSQEVTPTHGIMLDLPESAFKAAYGESLSVPSGEPSYFAQVLLWHPEELAPAADGESDLQLVLVHKTKPPIIRFDFMTPSPDRMQKHARPNAPYH